MLAGDYTHSLDYQERAVAFIDVLGFAALVKASDADPTARNKIAKLIATNELFEKFTSEMFPMDAAFFSDSFVLSMNVDRLFYLVRETGNLCRLLLLLGFPCRGAITAGALYHRERIVVGPALVNAYQLEQSVAIYPRIILDDVAMAHWKHEFRLDESGEGPAHADLEAFVKQDRDGQNFVDIFHPAWAKSIIPWTDDLQFTRASDFLKAVFKVIQHGLITHRENQNIYAKYSWLDAEYRNHTAVGR
jgi:hypothetical protein